MAGGFLGNMKGKLGKEVLINLAVLLAKDVLPMLTTNASSSILDKFERKISGRISVRAVKRFILFMWNGDMDDVTRIVKLQKKSDLLTDDATETVKHEIKKQEGGFLPILIAPMAASLIAPMESSLIQPMAW